MSPLLSILRRRVRLIAGATAVAVVMAVGVPAAVASYISTFTPSSQTVQTQHLTTTPVLSCHTVLDTSVPLTWTDADATTADPYGAFVISGYVIESKISPASVFTPIVVTPDVRSSLVLSATDSPNLGLLAVGVTITYQMHSSKGLWASATSNTVVATVALGVSGAHLISC